MQTMKTLTRLFRPTGKSDQMFLYRSSHDTAQLCLFAKLGLFIIFRKVSLSHMWNRHTDFQTHASCYISLEKCILLGSHFSLYLYLYLYFKFIPIDSKRQYENHGQILCYTWGDSSCQNFHRKFTKLHNTQMYNSNFHLQTFTVAELLPLPQIMWLRKPDQMISDPRPTNRYMCVCAHASARMHACVWACT